MIDGITENLTIEDLSFTRNGHSISSGGHLWHGRMIHDREFFENYVTKVGIFSPKEWNELALQVVRNTGKYNLYLAVKEHCRNLAWLNTEEQYSEYALSCMTSHVYESWKDFTFEEKEE